MVERRRWWARKLDDALPMAVETEEEFDLLGAFGKRSVDGHCSGFS